MLPLVIVAGFCVTAQTVRLRQMLEPKQPIGPPSHLFKPEPGAPSQFATYDPRLKPGARPFDLPAKDLRGKPLSLAQYRGKVVMLDFWATWCSTCMGNISTNIVLYRKLHPRGFEIVSISLDDAEVRSRLLGVVKSSKMPWRQVCEGEGWKGATARRFGVHEVPVMLLIGRDGRIAAVNTGRPPSEAAIQKALSRKEFSVGGHDTGGDLRLARQQPRLGLAQKNPVKRPGVE